MEEKWKLLAEKIMMLAQKNGETDTAALAWETGMKQGEVQELIRQMEEKNWLITYEIDMCCGAEYVIDGLTEIGKKELL